MPHYEGINNAIVLKGNMSIIFVEIIARMQNVESVLGVWCNPFETALHYVRLTPLQIGPVSIKTRKHDKELEKYAFSMPTGGQIK